MPLIPIRVRGKKRTAAEKRSAVAPVLSGPANPSLSPSPGSTESEAAQLRKKSQGLRPSRRVSILERLPVEVLVMVYTESQNMNLMYCNRHIHHALNNQYSNVRLVARAFAPTWSKHFGHQRSSAVSATADLWGKGYDAPKYAQGRRDIARCQEILINKKFFTIDIVLAAQQLWYDECQPKNGNIHCLPSCKCDHCKPTDVDHVYNAAECFEHDFQLAKAAVREGKEGWMQYRSRQDVEIGIKLQPDLLHAPWDENTERLVFWLVSGGICVDHKNWDPQTSINIVISHRHEHTMNAFFVYGAPHLVNFADWPLFDAYTFYLGNKPWPPGSRWNSVDRKMNDYLRQNFEDEDEEAIRSMRRKGGRDVDDSDAPYDPDNDSGSEYDYC